MTSEQDRQKLCETDRDFLEMLLYKIEAMRVHGQQWYAHKMQADERLYAKAKAELSEYVRLLKKRGYSGNRFNQIPPKQEKLF